MDWRSWRVCIAPGDAVVAREGSTVVLAHPSDPVHEQFLDELLGLCAEAARELPDATREMMVRRVGALITQAPPEAVPTFGLLTAAREGLVAVLVGDVRLLITAEGGAVEELCGRDASTFVDRALRGTFEELLMTVAPSPVPDLRSNLSGGVVRGSGVLLVPGRRAAAVIEPEQTLVDLAPVTKAPPTDLPAESRTTSPLPPPVAAPPPESAAVPAFIPISLTDLTDLTDSDRDPVNSSVEAAVDAAVPPEEAPLVQGIVCSRGHFNDPSANFCSGCGISMVHQTHNLVRGVRPPLGVLVVDDGAVFSLTCDYVLGREPEDAVDVLSGAASPLPLVDPDLVMSRVHARILLDGWEVRVEDAHSANGTFVATTPDAAWTRLEPGKPTTIQPGTRVALGGRALTFESHQHS